ncbi:LysR family transcriptional regulator [Loktanella sp. PT4BL]|jgi:DNA-binding transcriptional LysR family regulator|uniref:LysR family transcriptional regulator n=1 Tax=Loktanella sp. PT4BL TaxID=2135611 RepID=UPI000D75AA64|nr:LysR family transcriptional regulator [Loktanella sp. PT4BL]PXW70414.1 LysR family transcriptional regulator [Loktanella sp. PT4BL]
MSMRALRTLISIHRHGSFRAAAEAENLTAAAVSQQMRNLEASWQLALFERSHRSPKFTPTGLALVEEAEAIVAVYDGLADKVRSGAEVAGELILGAVPTTLTGLVPLALTQLKMSHPGIRVRVVPGLSNQLLLQIERGQIHAAVISKPDLLPRSLRFSKIAAEDLVLLVTESTEKLPVLELLQSQPFIRFNRDAVVGRQIEGWLQANGIAVNDVMELEGLEAISSMVAAGLGISIVPNRCIIESDHLPLERLHLGDDVPSRLLGLVSRADSPKAMVIQAAETALLKAVSIGEFHLGS